MFRKKFLTTVIITVLNLKLVTSELPVVMWHGMGDSCCFPFSLGSIKELIQEEINDVYVKSLKIGGNLIEDYASGFFIHPNKQVTQVCEQLANDPELSEGYNAIGFSQGGQFLRAVAQRCPNPPMHNLISLGGQHQGVFGLPNCNSLSKNSCEYVRKLLHYAAYTKVVQKALVQATYWHDPLHEQDYRKYSTFLGDINNEYEINEDYITNLKNLKNFVMVKFTEDTIVEPKESQWFEFYRPGQDSEILRFNESAIFLENKLGLREMLANGQIRFLESPGNHLKFTREWFIENIIPYLKNQ